MKELEQLYDNLVDRVCKSLRDTPEKWECLGIDRHLCANAGVAIIHIDPSRDEYGTVTSAYLKVVMKVTGDTVSVPLGIVDDWKLIRALKKFYKNRENKYSYERLRTLDLDCV